MKNQKLLSVLLILLTMFGGSCASKIILNDRQPVATPVTESTPEIPVDDFTERLRGVQTGAFDYVYAFRRKDGDILSSEDKKYLKENSPLDVNQWVLTSDQKVAIAGSNYRFMPENLEALKNRFNVEDYSNIIEESNTNTNKATKQSNTNINKATKK